MTDEEIEQRFRTAALDEIYRLRQLLAYYAQGTAADLEYKTFPKSRREIAEKRVGQMRAAARGEAQVVAAPISYQTLRYSLRNAGASELLTYSSFLKEQGIDG